MAETQHSGDSLQMNGSQQGAGTPQNTKSQENESQRSDRATELLRVEFIINTYPDLQPFLEMAVLLLEGVYEHKRRLPVPTDSSKN